MDKEIKEKLIKLAILYKDNLKEISEKELNKLKLQNMQITDKIFCEKENKKIFSLENDFLETLISSLRVEGILSKMLNKTLIKVEGNENDYLIATSLQGIEYLDFIQAHYKDEGFNSILNRTMFKVHSALDYNPSFALCGNLELEVRGVEKPLILEIPKCIKKEVTLPKDIQKMFQDIKGIVEQFYIKNFSLDSIFYVESIDKYIILDIEEYVPLKNNVELDLEQFLYDENIYKYKGKPLSFEDHQLI